MRKFHYGWVVCAACTVLMFCTVGIAITAFSVHQPFIISANGFTNSQASAILTVRYLFCIATTFLVDKVIRCLGMRRTALVALLCEMMGFAIYGMSRSFFTYCVGSAFVGLSQGIGGMVLVSMVITTWFKSHQGVAIGICAAGSGLASIVCPPVITAIIENTSLSTAFLMEGGFILLCAVLVYAVIRNSPEEKSLTAYYAVQTQQKKVNNYGGELHTVPMTVLCLLYLLLGCVMVIDTGYVSTLYTEAGHGAGMVSLLLSINGVLLAVSKVLYGVFSDRRGGRWTNTAFLSALLAGQAVHCFSHTGSYGLAIAAQIMTGIGLPVGTVGVSVTAMNFSSVERFPKRVKTLQMMMNIGQLAFSIVPGVLADVSGNYRISFIFCFGVVAVYFFTLEGLYRCSRRKESGGEI